jgi:hypothetical protein
MTEAETLVGLLGKSSDSPEVAAWLSQAGAKPPKLPKGDTDAYVVLKDRGLELMFTDEAKHQMRNDIAIGEGALILSNVRFNSAAVPEFKPYAGPLPYGLAFPNSQADVQRVLGKPEQSNPRLRMDRWTREPHRAFAKYKEGLGELESFNVQLPPKGR